MKISKSSIILKAIVFAVAIGSSIAYNAWKPECEILKNGLLALLIISTCLTIFISFYPDFVSTFKKIDKRGCFSIYDTIDCDDIVENLVSKIKNGERVIYQDCSKLNETNICNLKLKIYQYFSCTKIKHLHIGNVHYIDKYDIDKFNEQIFENHIFSDNIFIFDCLTTNEYFINILKKHFPNFDYKITNNYLKNFFNFIKYRIFGKPGRKIKSTVIIYLSNQKEEPKCDETSSQKSNDPDNKNTVLDIIYIESVIKAIQKRIKELIEKQLMNKDEGIHNVTTLYELLANDRDLCEKLKSCKNDTDVYSYELDKIIIRYYLKVGKYDKALNNIIKVISRNKQNVINDYDFIYILADAFHLSNRYSLALKLIKKYDSYSMDEGLKRKYNKLELHILKHQGKFDKSIEIGESLKTKFSDYDLYSKLLSIYMLRTINDKLDKPIDAILKDKIDFSELIKDFTPESLDVIPRYNMYKAIIVACKDINQSMRLIDDCIEFFEKTNHRYIYNAYYVKAELLRYMNCFKEAYQYYLKSSGIYDNHYDKNLLDQNYFSTKCLEKIGLVNGNLSERIKEYKKNNDLSEAYNNSIKHISDLINFNYTEEEETLEFNKRLLSLVDDNNFDADKIKAILLKYLFIIL